MHLYTDLDLPEEDWIMSTTQAERLANRVQGVQTTWRSARYEGFWEPLRAAQRAQFWKFFTRSMAARKGWATRRAK